MTDEIAAPRRGLEQALEAGTSQVSEQQITVSRQGCETRNLPALTRLCPTRTPEPHWLGEFPMTCYNCHIEADS